MEDTMKIKYALIALVIGMVVFSSPHLSAMKSVTFLLDGNAIDDTIVDMSSQSGQVEYRNNLKVHRGRIWMINFESGNWDYPNERAQLSRNTDTIFLRNGQVMNVTIIDFSSRRNVFEFQQGGSVHESNIKRIYFCCTELPGAYQKQSQKKGHWKDAPQDDYYPVTFMVDGRVIDSPLKYLDMRKSGFEDGLQVNTKDIWMINFEDDEMDFPRERQKLDRRMDTIFLTNGRVLYGNVLDFKEREGTFVLRNMDPVHYSQISRVYFCCNSFPDALRNLKRYKRIQHSRRRRY
jgi:sRNA-binding regulator protein Hfq